MLFFYLLHIHLVFVFFFILLASHPFVFKYISILCDASVLIKIETYYISCTVIISNSLGPNNGQTIVWAHFRYY